ncbi:unnamed protein product, partial [Musa textilis]
GDAGATGAREHRPQAQLPRLRRLPTRQRLRRHGAWELPPRIERADGGDRRLHQCGCYIDGFDFSAERVTRSIDESLARLKLDYVDILHCHDIEFGSLDQIVNETIPVLQKIRETGKARFIGITGLPLGIFSYFL